MDSNQIISDLDKKLQGAVSYFEGEAKKLRTGRAHPSMLDGIMVEAYGQQMPLIQVGTITVPEPQLLQITPFDPNNMEAIAGAIREDQALGLNPTDDGRIIRVPIPQLTSERRAQIVKQLNEKVEQANISMRNARHEAIKALDEAKKSGSISQDEHVRKTKQIDEKMGHHKEKIDSLAKAKEQDILTL